MKLEPRNFKIGVLALALAVSPAFAQDKGRDWSGEAKDAWIDGKLESSYLLNSELNSFKIDTIVENGRVTLNGYVPSETHKELAGEIAKNLDGVGSVNNNLEVGQTVSYSDNDRNFSTRFYDMTTTVSLKSNFALNSELEAHEINIDTKDGVVTLEGEVSTRAESMLAEEIASSYDHVSEVRNNLRVVANSD